MKIVLTKLEETLIEKVIRPALSPERSEPKYFSSNAISQSLNFLILLTSIKKFYEEMGGKHWNELLSGLK